MTGRPHAWVDQVGRERHIHQEERSQLGAAQPLECDREHMDGREQAI